MDTDLQPKKPSSQTKKLSKHAATCLKITENAWWPFDRVDGKLLEKMNKDHIKQTQELALW